MHRTLLQLAAILATLPVLIGCLDPNDPGNLVAKTVDEDPSLPRIEVNGTMLHAETFGDPNDPLIMVLHGGPGGDYRGLLALQALADDGYFVVFWDQRGSGLSRRHDADVYTMDLILEDLRQVIDYYGDRPMVFIGHSWGAMYATWFIDTYGDYDGRIQGAVLSEPGAFTKKQLDQFIADSFGSLDFFSEELNDVTWAGQFLTAADHARADYQQLIMTSVSPPALGDDPDNPAPSFRSGAVCYATLLDLVDKEGFDWTQNLHEFAPTVLFLRSDRDKAMPLSHQQELASNFASSEIITIEDSGHELIWERPDEYLAEVRAYLQRIAF